MQIPLLSLIFQGIPEQIALVTLAFILAKIKIDWKKIVLLGVFLAFTAYALRLLPITFGTHTIILIGLLFPFLIQFCQVPFLIALKASLVSFLTLIVVEYVLFTSIINLFGISFELYFTDVFKRTLIGLPQVFVLFIIAFVIFKIRHEREIK